MQTQSLPVGTFEVVHASQQPAIRASLDGIENALMKLLSAPFVKDSKDFFKSILVRGVASKDLFPQDFFDRFYAAFEEEGFELETIRGKERVYIRDGVYIEFQFIDSIVNRRTYSLRVKMTVGVRVGKRDLMVSQVEVNTRTASFPKAVNELLVSTMMAEAPYRDRVHRLGTESKEIKRYVFFKDNQAATGELILVTISHENRLLVGKMREVYNQDKTIDYEFVSLCGQYVYTPQSIYNYQYIG